MENKMITKIFPSFTKSLDAETGIVEAYVSVFGIMDQDDPPDIIELGAFAKTIQERGPAGARKIRVLHQHTWKDVIGMPLALVEHTRDMLPPELLALFPAATGGLFARTQFAMDVQLGRETYALYKMGAMDEWSIGFDYIQSEFVRVDGVEARLNKELKLWEYSPVTWGCNQATVTTAVKQDGRPASEDAVASGDAGPLDGRSLMASGTKLVRADGAPVRAEPHQEDALTREMRLREIQILEADLAIKSARLRR